MWLVGIALAMALSGAGEAPNSAALKDLKRAEAQLGIPPTGNFARTDARTEAYYRCYFTGPLELPSSYDKLRLREGTKDGCPIDSGKYDVFYYRIESVASGHAPVTQSLSADTAARLAMVVPHEDFHEVVKRLPDRIAEAAATLAGFLVAETASRNAGAPAPPAGDAALFLRKSTVVNRYFSVLSELYGRFLAGTVTREQALTRKRELFASLLDECGLIQPAPRSFNRCVSAPNNAGLAFDYTYTAFYPLLYDVYRACGGDARCTIGVIRRAPESKSEDRVAAYFEDFIRAACSSGTRDLEVHSFK